MKKLYQKSWHNIDFSSFAILDSNALADETFYEKFYKIFFTKYNSFDELDNQWKESKYDTAKEILKLIGNNQKNVLSIGCGIGITEKYIIEHFTNINLIALEPSLDALRWLKELEGIQVVNGYFPDALLIIQKEINCSVAFANAIDYVFDNVQYKLFLRSIIEYGINEFIMISVSVDKSSFFDNVKQKMKSYLEQIGLYDLGQFWGYMRTVEEHSTIMIEAGFNVVELVYENADTIIIKAIIK